MPRIVGFHTRFGDVRPLNQAVDDRYVIMNAGDEMALRFPSLPPPPAGWETPPAARKIEKEKSRKEEYK